MATTEPADHPNRVRVTLLAVGVLAIICVAALIWVMRPPPQIGTDRKVFDTVDALFTAVTAHDEKRLGECEQRLRGYREAGTLPRDAEVELDAIIRKARSGSWQSAAERLYDFMKGQKREGAIRSQESGRKSTG